MFSNSLPSTDAAFWLVWKTGVICTYRDVAKVYLLVLKGGFTLYCTDLWLKGREGKISSELMTKPINKWRHNYVIITNTHTSTNTHVGHTQTHTHTHAHADT